MKKQDRLKALNVGSIPNAWDVVRLGEIANEFIGGGTPSTANPDYWNGNIAWMTSAHIDGKLVVSGQRYITEKGLNESSTHLIPKGNLLVSTRVGIGKAAINLIDIAISQDLTGVILKKDKTDVEFVYWFLLNNSSKLKSLAQGSTIKGLLKDDLANLQIPFPPLPEQRAIASILGTVDSAIQKVNGAIEKTERLKRGLMQRLLTKGIGHSRFKDSEVGRIPEEWEILELKRVGMVRTGKTPPTSKEEYWNGEIPFITPAELGNSKYTNRTERCVTREGAELVGIIPKNSVLVVCIGSTIGKVGINAVDSVTNQQLNSVIPDNSFDYNYVYYSLANKCELIKNYSGVAAVPIINKSTFEKIKIAIPECGEQKKLAEILSTVDRKLELERARKGKLERVKTGLMNELLTGRKRVTL